MSPRVAPLLSPPIGFGHVPDQRDPAQDDTNQTAAGLDAYLRLIHLGVTGLAATLWITEDELPVLSDKDRVSPIGTLAGRLRRRRLHQVTSDKLPPSVVRLDDLLQHLEPDHQLSLRLGSRQSFEPAIDAIRTSSDNLESSIWFRHNDLSLLTDLRPRTSARLVSEQRKAEADGGLERQAAALEERDIDGLLLPHQEWSAGRTTLLHRFGRLALGSGAVHERELAELTASGIDGVHSDHVARMMAVIVEYYGTIGGGTAA